jgi:hypothetical protein
VDLPLLPACLTLFHGCLEDGDSYNATAVAGSCLSFAAIALVTSVCSFGPARPLTTGLLPHFVVSLVCRITHM